MRQLVEKIADLSADAGFHRFQNDLAQEIYQVLGEGYASNENEVELVKRLVGSVDGKSYKGLSLSAAMLHGPKSWVEFNYMDKPVTKELGDMVVLSVVTAGARRLLQRICIVQNKKDVSRKWTLDLEQLYLLKNFPTFSGNKGVFRNCRDVMFRNNSGCLGGFGFFVAPGEMVLASAPLVTELLRGRKTLGSGDLSVLPQWGASRWGIYSQSFPWLPSLVWRHPKEFIFFLEETLHRYGPLVGLPHMGSGFMGNVHFSRDLYDFARDWTQLNIGETSYAYDRVTNSGVDAFANAVMRQAGFPDLPDLPSDDVLGEREFGASLAVLMMRLDTERED